MADDTHDILRNLVDGVACKPGWSFRLKDEDGALRLVIRVIGYDSSEPDEGIPRTIDHYFPVPTATYNEKTWRRWIFERCRYTVHEYRPVDDMLRTQDGSMREPYEA